MPNDDEDGVDIDAEQLVSEWQQSATKLDTVLNAGDRDPMTVVNQARKRNMDAWCFAEHMEPEILLQVRMGRCRGIAVTAMDGRGGTSGHPILTVNVPCVGLWCLCCAHTYWSTPHKSPTLVMMRRNDMEK